MEETLKTEVASKPAARFRVPDLLELTKVRLTFLVLLTTLAGFYLGTRESVRPALLAHVMLGTALVAASASALNQVVEKDSDAKMRRTRERPIPAGRMQENDALLLAILAGVGGLAYLAFLVNLLSAALAALTLATYIFLYTPLKQISSLNTLVGAIPGALPPIIGWAAARGELTPGCWTLFAILFLWQMPHFLAIAWLFRSDYAQAGLKMLPVIEPGGESTGRQAVLYAAALIPISLTPVLFGFVGVLYTYGALLLGLIFLFFAGRFWWELSDIRARHLFFASIIYLPLLFSLMALDKLS